MKKLITFFVLLAAVVSYAGAPTGETVDANYVWELDPNGSIDSDGAYDTLAADNDSTAKFLSGFKPDKGYQYILVRDAITGTGSDSVEVEVVVDTKDGSGNLLYRTLVDSFTSSAGEAIFLPIGETLIGHKFDVHLKAGAAVGTQVILNRLYLYRRKAVVRTSLYDN